MEGKDVAGGDEGAKGGGGEGLESLDGVLEDAVVGQASGLDVLHEGTVGKRKGISGTSRRKGKRGGWKNKVNISKMGGSILIFENF